MPYIRNTNLKNRKANERLEREDKNAGSSQVHGNASAGVGAAAPASTTPSSNNQSEIGNATVNANVSTETPTSPTPSAPKKKNTENAGLRGGLRDQLKKEAGIVSKLPEDFPIDRWESLNTKQQRHALKFSGLDDKEQWVLLNASAPLSVLDELNQAQNQAAMRAHITALFSPMASPARQRETASDSLRPYSTSLQNNAWQRELERRREHREQRGYTSPTQTEVKKSGNPIQPVERSSQSGGSGEDDSEKETLWEKIASWFKDIFSPEEPPEPASSTPQMFTMVTVPPTASPTPTPSPSHSPTPELTERDQLAQNIVDLALAKADIGYPYQLGGGSDKRGYDCSGLVRALCRDIGSGIKFGQGYISKSCEDGMAEDFIKKGYCDVVFDYHDGAKITSLAPGDLVFFASPNVLSIDKHVAIATGNGLQVVEASDVVHRVTDEFDAYKDDKGNGIYVRDSGQIITYIIRPYYDWKEQP